MGDAKPGEQAADDPVQHWTCCPFHLLLCFRWPPAMADFDCAVATPIAKHVFREILQRLGPHSPLPSQSPLLTWQGSAAAKDAVHAYRVMCHAATRTLLKDEETFASCVNKAAYWLSSVSFLNSLRTGFCLEPQSWRRSSGKDHS